MIQERKSTGASLNDIHEICGKGTRSPERKEVLDELQARGLVTFEKLGKKVVFHAR